MDDKNKDEGALIQLQARQGAPEVAPSLAPWPGPRWVSQSLVRDWDTLWCCDWRNTKAGYSIET